MRSRFLRTFGYVLLGLLPLMCGAVAHAGEAGSGVIINPKQHNFGIVAVGLKTDTLDIQVSNFGTSKVTVNSFSLDNTGFQLTQGVAPVSLNVGETTHYTVIFAPTKGQVYSGNFTVNISNGQVLKCALSGTGQVSHAAASLSTTLMDFGTVTQGQTVAKQSVTITNTGTQSMKLDAVVTDPPFTTNFGTTTTISPGGSYTLNVNFYPGAVGPVSGLIVLCYNSVPAQGITLTANVTAATKLAISTFPNLPSATQSSPYTAFLNVASGKAPYRWKLETGSTLPAGLTLDSSTGTISGTLAASVGIGTYTFNVMSQDSSAPPQTATKKIILIVKSPTGANCNNTSWNISGTNSPILGLDVLGTGKYLGYQGGLYPDGSNLRPDDHTNAGITIAQGIQPLDANGNPDPNGKEVVAVIGESNVHIEAEGLALDASVDPQKNPSVLVIDASLGDATSGQLADPNSPFWTTILDYIIPNYGVTPQQVVAAWIEPNNGINSGTFPSDISRLQANVESEVQNLHTLFPNLKLAYLSSRIYSGYSNGITDTDPEPYGFEDSFAVKWTIQDQLDGQANLNYDPDKGPVLAPWISWGPYTWANGMLIPSTTGYVWNCQNFKDDGNHPTKTNGKEQVAHQVLQFLKTDPTSTPWFLAPQ